MKNKKSKQLKIISVVLLLTSILLFTIPSIQKWQLNNQQKIEYQKYQERTNKLSKDAIKKIQLKWLQYNKYVRTKRKYKQSIPLSKYQSIQYDEVFGTLTVKNTNIKDLIIGFGVNEKTLSQFAGHLPETSLPVGNEYHTLIAGHSGLQTAKIFSELEKIEVGEIFYIEILGQQKKYKIIEKNIVPANYNVFNKELDVRPGKKLVTLQTCVPIYINSDRLLLTGEEIK